MPSMTLPKPPTTTTPTSAPQRMRITFILPHAGLSGGVRVVAIYAQKLKARGHEIKILSLPYRLFGLRARFQNMWHKLGLLFSGKPEPSHLNGVDIEHRRLPTADRLLKSDIPLSDIVVATWWETAERLAPLDLDGAAKAYFVQHLEAHDGQPIDRVKATWRLPMQKITVARWLTNLARDHYNDDSAITVPNAVDLEQFAVPPRGKQPKPTVGLMYSKTRYKGCDIALKAVEIARQTIPDLQLVAFGMPDRDAENMLPADTQYTQLPPQETIKDIYGACDAWLFASRSEGFGLPILEAMACRTPVIATPAGAAPELMEQGGGILVNAESPEDMAAAIVRIARLNEAQWKRMSDAAYTAACRYTWDDATDLFESALRQTIQQSKRNQLAAA